MRSLTALALLLASTLAPGRAQAVEIGHHFGLGYASTLAQAQGLSLRYFATREVGLELVLGLASVQPNTEGADAFSAVNVAGGFSFVLAHDERGQLSLGTRFDVGSTDADGGVLDIALEVPLTIEYFVVDHFSLFASVGLVVGILKDDTRVLVREGTLDSISAVRAGKAFLLGTGQVLGGAGFTVWL